MASSPRYHQHLKSTTLSFSSLRASSSLRIRLTALLFPEPQGPLIAIVVPTGLARFRRLVATARANALMPYWSSSGRSMGLSLKYLDMDLFL